MTPQAATEFRNPFRPGAGHMPPHLAGRQRELGEFKRLLDQETILENLVLTGLRGVGKTVLLEVFKPLAITSGWLWVGTDLSESSSVTEEKLAIRLLADLSVVTSSVVASTQHVPTVGFSTLPVQVQTTLDYNGLTTIYNNTPGLVSDRLKAVLELSWAYLSAQGKKGLIFAYDEAQNLADHAAKEEFPLSLILDVFQSVQRKGVPFMLALTGLPTLFPKLVEARTFSERMFRVVFLDRLTHSESEEAVLTPIQHAQCPVVFTPDSVATICEHSGGYPYFIQFICREVFDVFIQQATVEGPGAVPLDAITRKLDSDFFAGRWARVTDRQRELLIVVAMLTRPDVEFTVQEVVEKAPEVLDKPFSNSHANQLLASLCSAGLIYKNRYGKYSFAVPLLGEFIKRQISQGGIQLHLPTG